MAILALEDGRVFRGRAFGAQGVLCGEVVFNTGMAGYQEILTDPSYAGQIVCMTYPHIGNYGINSEDTESSRPWVSGFIVRELSQIFSNWRGQNSLERYLTEHNIIGLCEVDTRALTRHIRERGARRGCLSSFDVDPQELIERARRAPTISEFNWVSIVGCAEPYSPSSPSPSLRPLTPVLPSPSEGRGAGGEGERGSPPSLGEETGERSGVKRSHIVVVDFGVKRNILKNLQARAQRVTVVPHFWRAKEILRLNPDGIVLSNGPGDPAILKDAIRTARALIDSECCPIFGICLGHQILGLALGARVYKLKFGHRGANQPVKNLLTNRVEITSHNHGFALADLPDEVELTHINLNDGSIEGFRHKKLPIFAVQYHPEASPGPHDALSLFDQFFDLIKSSRPCPSAQI